MTQPFRNNGLRGDRTYNILLPLWILLWFPSWLQLLIIPANYVIDRFVLRWSLPANDIRERFCRTHTWKLCLAGFLSDFVGSCLLLGVAMVLDLVQRDWANEVMWGIEFNVFSNVLSLLVTCAAIAISGLCIYFLDLLILDKAGLEQSQAKASALKLAIFTAPYLFLVPSMLLYG